MFLLSSFNLLLSYISEYCDIIFDVSHLCHYLQSYFGLNPKTILC